MNFGFIFLTTILSLAFSLPTKRYRSPAKAEIPSNNCRCSDFTYQNGAQEVVGNCEVTYSVIGRPVRLCYVHLPNDCRDKIFSGRLPGMVLSEDACENVNDEDVIAPDLRHLELPPITDRSMDSVQMDVEEGNDGNEIEQRESMDYPVNDVDQRHSMELKLEVFEEPEVDANVDENNITVSQNMTEETIADGSIDAVTELKVEPNEDQDDLTTKDPEEDLEKVNEIDVVQPEENIQDTKKSIPDDTENSRRSDDAKNAMLALELENRINAERSRNRFPEFSIDMNLKRIAIEHVQDKLSFIQDGGNYTSMCGEHSWKTKFACCYNPYDHFTWRCMTDKGHEFQVTDEPVFEIIYFNYDDQSDVSTSDFPRLALEYFKVRDSVRDMIFTSYSLNRIGCWIEKFYAICWLSF